MMNDLFELLCLLSVPGVGPYRIRNLVSHFGSAKAALEGSARDLCIVDGIDEYIAENIKKKLNKSFADKQISHSQKSGVQIITFWDPEYPDLLRKIYDPPVLLFIRGVLSGKDENRIAVVGMRYPSYYGSSVAERFGEDLARMGIVVVSGMARGIDTKAHWGAIKGEGRTLAVLGCGLDIIYPPENVRLYEQITERGAVISEFPMTTKPVGSNFPRRNRIISGLSLGTVVVEARERSGALITAYMALDQGREVFAVPGSIKSEKSKGTHRLIREGARLAESVSDIISEIPEYSHCMDKGNSEERLIESLTSSEKLLWDILSEEPIHIDQIASCAKKTTSEVLALLLCMELKNSVKQLSGKMFVRY